MDDRPALRTIQIIHEQVANVETAMLEHINRMLPYMPESSIKTACAKANVSFDELTALWIISRALVGTVKGPD